MVLSPLGSVSEQIRTALCSDVRPTLEGDAVPREPREPPQSGTCGRHTVRSARI